MDKKVILSATDKLELLNIVLHESNFIRDSDMDPFTYPSDIDQQNMMSVSTEELSYDTSNDTLDIFRSYVSLGLRGVTLTGNDENEVEILFTIEATFRVDYLLKESLLENEAKEFSEFNSVHNVWPFWRNYVFDTLRAADLPKLNVPLMRGMNVNKKGKKKISKKKTSKINHE